MENLSSLMTFILCGGKGTRLNSLELEVPKPLAPIGQKPFLSYLIDFLKASGFKNEQLVFLVGHLGEKIEKTLGPQFSYSFEKEPLGTGGALRLGLQNFPSSAALVLNGDSLFLFDLPDFIQKGLELFKHHSEVQVVIALKEMQDAKRYGLVRFDKDGLVEEFAEKKAGSGFINTGIYLVRSELQNVIGPGWVSLENEVFLKLVREKKVAGIKGNGEFLDIGTVEDFKKAQTLIPQWMMRV